MSAELTPSLAALQQRLKASLESGFRHEVWGAPQAMTKVLASIKAQFDVMHVAGNERSIAQALYVFKTTGDLSNFIELKYACLGISQSIGKDEWQLIEDNALFQVFLQRVDKEQAQLRRFRKCYQALIYSYFSFDLYANSTGAAKQNWQLLQQYLRERLDVALSASHQPNWLKVLSDHRNMLSDDPCGRYAASLLKGNSSELQSIGDAIGFGKSSWVWQQAMLAHTQAVIARKIDNDFREVMEPLLEILSGKGPVVLSPSIISQCVALVLVRYTYCVERPEHPVLRDIAVNAFGNPWLKKVAWDAEVGSEAARKMVDGWLKARLITDFFALLSEEGATDERRLKYWLRFSEAIEDMWFVLGSTARNNNSPEFREMRKRMDGRMHYLEGSGNTGDNNAFIMRIGSLMAVEFGLDGNACYIFQHDDFKVDMSRRFIDIANLRGSNNIARLIHRGVWEPKFDEWICPRVSWYPERSVNGARREVSQQYSAKSSISNEAYLEISDLRRIEKLFDVRINDLRQKGGAIWVLAQDGNTDLNEELIRLGFKYKSPKGWWRE